jgi:hypothetical protein
MTVFRYHNINLLEHIKELTKPIRVDNIYNSVSNVYSKDIFGYIVLIIVILFGFSFIEINIAQLLGFAIGVIIILFMIQRDVETINTFTVDNENKLKFLDGFLLILDDNIITSVIDIEEQSVKPLIMRSYLKLDPIIVNFLYDMREYMFYNASAYRKIILNINNMLLHYTRVKHPKKEHDAKYNKKYNYDIIVEMRDSALNNLHSLIHTNVSAEKDNKKHSQAIKMFQRILEGYVSEVQDIIQAECKQGLRAYSYFVEKEVPKNHDNTKYGFNKHFNFF